MRQKALVWIIWTVSLRAIEHNHDQGPNTSMDYQDLHKIKDSTSDNELCSLSEVSVHTKHNRSVKSQLNYKDFVYG